MSKKPWEAGYTPPEPAPVMSKVEAGRIGGQTRVKRREEGLPVKPPRKSKPGPVADPNSACAQKAAWETAENISLKRRTFLDRFIREYLRDFNASMAYIRADGAPSHATTGGPEALRSAYVQMRLAEVVDMLEEEDLLTRKDILLGLKKEANSYGIDSNSASRVRAWSQLAKIKGMEVQKTETKVTHQGGVMLVPMAPSLQSWEEQAANAQRQLKHDVRK
jgi:hypothetical protein